MKWALHYLSPKSQVAYGLLLTMIISETLALMAIDGVLIYRCWVVYEKSWGVICVPITFWFASLASAILATFYDPLSHEDGSKATVGYFACNVAITVYTTTAIIYRIWSTRRTGSGSSKQLSHVIRVLAESGILYTSTIIFCLVGQSQVVTHWIDTTWVDSLVNTISDAINFSIGGITFNLIIIRVYQTRVELRDSFADSRHVDGDQTLSRIQFDNPQLAASSEGPSSNMLGEASDEIREPRRSQDGMHEN